MIVRSNRWVDACLLIFLVASAAICLMIAADQSRYQQDCLGIRNCVVFQAFKNEEILGLNPMPLAPVLLVAVLLPLALRRFLTGSAAELKDGLLSIPSLLGTRKIQQTDIQEVVITSRMFSFLSVVMLHTKDGRNIGIGNARPSDIEALKLALKLAQPAEPATLPAT